MIDPATFSPAKTGLTGPTIEDIKLQATGSVLHVDGHRGSHDFPGDYTGIAHEPSGRFAVEIGDTLELTTTNETGSHHPFHLHGFSIQPMELIESHGLARTTRSRTRNIRDNIDVPAGYTLRYRRPAR